MRKAVLIPGIMGSTLEYQRDQHTSEVVWGENFVENYRRLIDQPESLTWNHVPARARLLKTVKAKKWGASVKVCDLWEGLISGLRAHPAFEGFDPMEFGYDWRAPLEDSANELAGKLAETLENQGGGTKFTFFAHSMGGLVLRVGLGAGILDPGLIERIIYIGTPLKGSPASFSGAYGQLDLPFFREIFNLFNFRHADTFQATLLRSFRGFPSLYYLFPPKGILYLLDEHDVRSNPLDGNYMEEEQKAIAERAQQLLNNAQTILQQHNVRQFCIHTSVHSSRPTEMEYRVIPRGRGYEVLEIVGRTILGDGTVLASSACHGFPAVALRGVKNVTHASMCNDRDVFSAILAFLGDL
jgi:pimeloyl-ACP methyl ester carboxylesterase